ncbi:MAG: outer membrane lipoprotein carrier protein LolA [Aestuariivita sp.]|nr:outer membrane lipoprotein carrier protein LolA [Aestuariivita sp.]MCY4203316.1 outer membrane lipoprotein carrier protein LolA [Aestuariivita sp.]
MNRSLLTVLFFLFGAGVTAAEELSLEQLSRYLDELRSVQARFSQVNSDNSVSGGTLYLRRPGGLRLEYDPPENVVVVAGKRAIVIADPKSNAPPQTFPSRRTPLSVLLSDSIDLPGSDLIIDLSYEETVTALTVADPRQPRDGSIQLAFTDDPVSLSGWTLTDASGSKTSILLEELQTVENLPNALFNPTLLRPDSSK